MPSLQQMNPEIYQAAVRKQSELWKGLIAALQGDWEGSLSPHWRLEIHISADELLQDLAYGRD